MKYYMKPIYRKLKINGKTPFQVLSVLKNVSPNVFILESAENQTQLGRYTYLGYDPKLEISATDGCVRIKSGTTIAFQNAEPSEYIRKLLEENKSERVEGLPTFTGGLVGYFSYDYIKYKEKGLTINANDEEGFCDVDLMLFDKVIVFDHHKQEIILIINISLEDYDANYNKAMFDLNQMEQLICRGAEKKDYTGRLTEKLKPLFDREAYCKMVERAKNYICEGDIFQVVLSNRWKGRFEGSLLKTYEYLKKHNPSPYMFYFTSDNMELTGASPETLVKLEGETLYTFPLAGTRPRGKTGEEDRALEKELLADEKECAEHNMLVDLGRNDMGKISRFGTVNVEKYMEIHRYSHVMHIGSTVTGKIRGGMDAIDAIEAILPAGTLSGAPKLRACQIINELENNKRGIYGGAIGYIDFTGNMDVCIAIRMAYKRNGNVYVRSGAGIVADSIPVNEYTECENKARAVMKALEYSTGGGMNDIAD